MKVKDFLTASRWVNYFSNSPDKFCLVQAITHCYPRHVYACKVISIIQNELKRDVVSDWNDSPERTFEEVHALCVKLDI